MAKGAKTVPAAPTVQAQKAEPASGQWYAFSGGRTVAVDGPAAAGRACEPWTVQTRASGCLSIGATPYIALTGWGQEDDRRKSSAAGFDGHLVKPVNPETLDELSTYLQSSV